ncbi:hypothetical protein BDP27DRAFT_1164848, partial [Rhodocollybia butyracea]
LATFIGEVKAVQFKMEEAGLDVSDQEIILAITLGLLPSYATVISSFNTVAADVLTLDYVTNQLLNDEVAQLADGTSKPTTTNIEHDAKDMALAAAAPAVNRTCFFCDKHGHFKDECPE